MSTVNENSKADQFLLNMKRKRYRDKIEVRIHKKKAYLKNRMITYKSKGIDSTNNGNDSYLKKIKNITDARLYAKELRFNTIFEGKEGKEESFWVREEELASEWDELMLNILDSQKDKDVRQYPSFTKWRNMSKSEQKSYLNRRISKRELEDQIEYTPPTGKQKRAKNYDIVKGTENIYNLRRRKKANYNEDDSEESEVNSDALETLKQDDSSRCNEGNGNSQEDCIYQSTKGKKGKKKNKGSHKSEKQIKKQSSTNKKENDAIKEEEKAIELSELIKT
jgi:hypothetical protein